MTTTTDSAVLPRTSSAPPPMQMLEMLYGGLATQLLSVAAELGIADALAGERRDVDDLARRCGAHAGALYRTMRALAGLGVVTEAAPRTFALTPLGQTLRGDAPGSLRELARDVGGRTRLLAYSQLAHSVRTGQPAFDQAHGTSMWSYLQAHPQEVELFGKAMGNLAAHAHATAFSNFDLSGVRRLVDVGGGEGYLLATLLPRYPELAGVLFDEPHVVSGAARVLESAGVADRVEVTGGDVFSSVPGGGDLYVLSSILFSYEDTEARTILTNIRQAMDPAGRVLVLEPILPEGDTTHPGTLLDVCQLALHRGGVRGEADFAALFSSSGLRLAEARQMWPTGPTDLIVGVPD
jgi:hypothetical protein